MEQQFGKVAVMMGGTSSEREVSLMSGKGVLAALLSQGVDAHAFDPAHQALAELRIEGFQRVFICLHGQAGENGILQGVLESMRMPYTGCGVMASAIGMDKWRSKMLWQGAGLPVPAFALLDEKTDFAAVAEQLGLPVFVKPANEGSSVGISKAKTVAELETAYHEARRYDPVVLAERFIGGGEYTCAIVGDQALPTIRILPATEFYDYEAKYFRDDTQYLCPSDLSAEQEQEMRSMALAGFRAIGGRGWGRVDFLRDENDRLYLLEANTSPGMTSHSLVPMAAKQAGMSYEMLCLKILGMAYVG